LKSWQRRPIVDKDKALDHAAVWCACAAKLLAALPRCEDCGEPATRIGSDGDERDALCLCDACRPDQRLWEVETPQKETIDGMINPEVRWAEALRMAKRLAQ
jgi:hypothetical protein